jgi:hypothetical protein
VAVRPGVLPDRDLVGMERAQLEELLARGLSLAEIGRIVRRDPSTIGYWVKNTA